MPCGPGAVGVCVCVCVEVRFGLVNACVGCEHTRARMRVHTRAWRTVGLDAWWVCVCVCVCVCVWHHYLIPPLISRGLCVVCVRARACVCVCVTSLLDSLGDIVCVCVCVCV